MNRARHVCDWMIGCGLMFRFISIHIYSHYDSDLLAIYCVALYDCAVRTLEPECDLVLCCSMSWDVTIKLCHDR